MKRAAALLLSAGLASGFVHAFELCDNAEETARFHEALSSVESAYLEKRFGDLDGLLNGLMSGHRLGRIDDARLKRAFQGFETQSANFEPMILEWIRQYPKSPAAYLALGYHYMTRGLALAGRAPTGPSEAQAGSSVRELLYALEAFDVSDRLGARPLLSNAARVRIALAVPRLKNLDATALYRKTIQAHPEALEVRIQYLKGRAGNTNATLARIDSIIKDADKMNESDRRYVRYLGYQEKGVVLDVAGEKRRAAEEFERSAPLCPGLPRSVKLAAQQYDIIGDPVGLERTADAVVQRYSRNCWALSLRGKARRQLGRLPESFADYSRGAELACGEAFEGLAWFYENGQVVARDLKRTAELYGLAAAQGVEGARRKAEAIRASLPR